MPVTTEFIEELKQIVGPQAVSTSPIDKVIYMHSLAYDLFPWQAEVIVVPQSDPAGNHPIPQIVSLANKYKVPVTCKGGIGMGGSAPRHGGILIDMCRMEKVLEINEDLGYVVVEGGASVYQIMYELRQHGMTLPCYGTYESATNIGGTIINAGIGYGETRYGWLADMVTGLEVVLPNGDVVRHGSLANQYTEFGPFQRHVNGPDAVSLYIQSMGNFGVITKVALRTIHFKRENLHEYCYAWRRDQIEDFQKAMIAIGKTKIYDVHFNDRWTFHWQIQEGWLHEVPDDAWFFLPTMLYANNQKELEGQEELMRDVYTQYGGIEVPEIARVHMRGADPSRWTSWHVHGPGGWIGPAARNAGMFACMSFYYPLTKFAEMYQIDEQIKKQVGLWCPEHFPQHDSFVTNEQSIKEQWFCSWNPYNPEHLQKVGAWVGMASQIVAQKGACWHGPCLPNQPRYSFEKLGPAYDFLKDMKDYFDPNDILNPTSIR